MTDKPTIEQLRQLRAKMPGDWSDSAVLWPVVGALLDDLIERREATADADLLAECEVEEQRRGLFDRWVRLTHRPTGRWAEGTSKEGALAMLRQELDVQAPRAATALELLTDPTGDET